MGIGEDQLMDDARVEAAKRIQPLDRGCGVVKEVLAETFTAVPVRARQTDQDLEQCKAVVWIGIVESTADELESNPRGAELGQAGIVGHTRDDLGLVGTAELVQAVSDQLFSGHRGALCSCRLQCIETQPP